MRIIKLQQKGVSLLELIVATGIFVLVSLIVNGIYINVVNSQKRSIGIQTSEEAFRFAFEMMGKEIRAAQGSDTGSSCSHYPDGYYKIFNGEDDSGNTTTSDLYFENNDGECVIYEKIDDGGVGRIKISRATKNGYLTPNELNITELKFIINDSIAGTVGTSQPSITMMMNANIVNDPSQTIRMQTTISSREYTY